MFEEEAELVHVSVIFQSLCVNLRLLLFGFTLLISFFLNFNRPGLRAVLDLLDIHVGVNIRQSKHLEIDIDEELLIVGVLTGRLHAVLEEIFLQYFRINVNNSLLKVED